MPPNLNFYVAHPPLSLLVLLGALSARELCIGLF